MNTRQNVEKFYDYCQSLKFEDKDVVKMLKLAEINSGEISTTILRGYLPIAWSSCERIAKEMEACGIAKYVEKFSHPIVHLPQAEKDGWFRQLEADKRGEGNG